MQLYTEALILVSCQFLTLYCETASSSKDDVAELPPYHLTMLTVVLGLADPRLLTNRRSVYKRLRPSVLVVLIISRAYIQLNFCNYTRHRKLWTEKSTAFKVGGLQLRS